MSKTRPQRPRHRGSRATVYTALVFSLLVLGQLMQSVGWLMLPPEVFFQRTGSFPGDALLVPVWAALWPALCELAALVSPLSGDSPEAQATYAQGLSAWFVALPLSLVFAALSLKETMALRAQTGMLSPEGPVRRDPEAPLPPARMSARPGSSRLYNALDDVEEQLTQIQEELEHLRVALLNASLPYPLDDADEPLERARLACDRMTKQVMGLRAQQQVVQARAMGLRA